jgi:hypothetical protein
LGSHGGRVVEVVVVETLAMVVVVDAPSGVDDAHSSYARLKVTIRWPPNSSVSRAAGNGSGQRSR